MGTPPRFWKKRHSLWSVILFPLSLLWRLAGLLRSWMIQEQRVPVPVISVGNMTLGGGGKTPLVCFLAQNLDECAIVTRGYKGSLGKTPIQVKPHHRVTEVGDEALLLARHGPTWIAHDRYQGARMAYEAGAKVIILDDGHQNPHIKKDLRLLVVDGVEGWGNERIFPSGPLRESISRGLEKAHGLVITGEDTHGLAKRFQGHGPVFHAQVRPKDQGGLVQSLNPQKKVAAFAGIANPHKFLRTLKDMGMAPDPFWTFPDHHFFSKNDEEKLAELCKTHNVVTTEKDWVRLSPPLQEGVKPLGIQMFFLEKTFLSWVRKSLSI